MFALLALLVPAAGALLPLGLAVFVLSHNRQASANRWLAAGLAALGAYQASLLASTLIVVPRWPLLFLQLGLAAAGLIGPGWLGFGLAFGERRSSGPSRVRRWRPGLVALGALAVLGGAALATGRIIHIVPLRGAGGPGFVGLDAWGKLYLSGCLLGLALALLELERLYREASQTIRQKLSCLLAGAFVALGYQIAAAGHVLLYARFHPLHPFLSGLAFVIGSALIAFSVVRHRLLDVDIFISRYVVYRSVTLGLVGGYLFLLGLMAETLRYFHLSFDLLTGLFVALLGGAALILVLLSATFRDRLQGFIQTHFFRSKYDYRLEWMELTRRLSQATTMDEVAVLAVDRVLEVMRVSQAALYILTGAPGQLTVSYRAGYDALPDVLDLSPAVREALWDAEQTLPQAKGRPAPGHELTPAVRALFGSQPVGCLVPMTVRNAPLGLLLVGPRPSGEAFGADDRNLLLALTAQAGALLENARLSQEAVENRELQVFARLSSFVAHDLKNTVTMVSALAENAKLYLGDPEFQADAIRTLADATARMRNLLATLSSHRTQPAVPGRIGLAEAVAGWVERLSPQVPARIHLHTRLLPTPEALADAAQLESVVNNLVVNAIEATPADGTVTIETSAADGCAVLVVADTGRGMSPEFLRTRLFRPFQTTKARGLGIGLYQCRQVIQSFGGTITVESREGAGTRMIVRLPALEGATATGGAAAEKGSGREPSSAVAGTHA
jgi:putative PEP-CTERM system histidine kinase